jgi:DNA-binding winged helix-turn-helix (wHTH) protein
MSQDAASMGTTYRFGSFELDAGILELRQAGVPVRLGRVALALLAHFVANPGRTVSREEILERVWSVRIRSRSTVPTAIVALRRALGDDARHPRYVETVPGKGYRFVAAVGIREAGEPPASADMLARLVGPGFVGRISELGRLIYAARETPRGTLQSLLFFEEPGIGMSRLLEEFARIARAERHRCAVARCPEDEGAPALWPWLEIPRSDTLQKAASPAAEQERVALVERLSGGISVGRKSPSLGDAAEERFRLFDAVARLLEEIARSAPLILIFDDLHRADPTSISSGM